MIIKFKIFESEDGLIDFFKQKLDYIHNLSNEEILKLAEQISKLDKSSQFNILNYAYSFTYQSDLNIDIEIFSKRRENVTFLLKEFKWYRRLPFDKKRIP